MVYASYYTPRILGFSESSVALWLGVGITVGLASLLYAKTVGPEMLRGGHGLLLGLLASLAVITGAVKLYEYNPAMWALGETLLVASLWILGTWLALIAVEKPPGPVASSLAPQA